MRFLLPGLLAFLFAACAPTRPPQKKSPPAPAALAVAKPVAEPTPSSAPSLPVTPPAAPRVAGRDISGITFEGAFFDSRSHRLVVADQSGGPGSRFADAAAAAHSAGGIAAVNAGFFTPEGAPLGLVVAAGKRSGGWNSASSLGSGIWFEDGAAKSAIARRGALGRMAASGMRELIQAGPLLIEHGQAVGGLDPLKSSARTMILWDGGNRWWIGCSSPCTLAEVAAALARGAPGGWSVREALNLDGGRSSDLWISASVAGGPVERRPPWNRPVRNFLILVPR